MAGEAWQEPMPWTDERVETLRKLWGEGKSAKEIAYALGGVSRSAVIGKIHRVSLNGRVSNNRAKATHRPKAKKPKLANKQPLAKAPRPADDLPSLRAALAAMDAMPPGEVGTSRKGVIDLDANDCRWPIGDPQTAEFHFCAREKLTGLSYCEFHARKAFQPPTGKRERPYLKDQLEIKTRRTA